MRTNFVFARLSGDKLENIEMSRGGRPSNTLLGTFPLNFTH